MSGEKWAPFQHALDDVAAAVRGGGDLRDATGPRQVELHTAVFNEVTAHHEVGMVLCDELERWVRADLQGHVVDKGLPLLTENKVDALGDVLSKARSDFRVISKYIHTVFRSLEPCMKQRQHRESLDGMLERVYEECLAPLSAASAAN